MQPHEVRLGCESERMYTADEVLEASRSAHGDMTEGMHFAARQCTGRKLRIAHQRVLGLLAWYIFSSYVDSGAHVNGVASLDHWSSPVTAR